MNEVNLTCPKAQCCDKSINYELLVCDACGADAAVDIPSTLNFRDVIDVDKGPVWRYESLIPAPYISNLDDPIEPHVMRSARLEATLGVQEAWLLDATRLATGTFKDYEATVIAAASVHLGYERISVHSTGNTAAAYREYAMRVGLPCASYIPSVNLSKLGGATGSLSHPIYALDAPYSDVSALAKQAARDAGWHHMAPMRWKLQGKAALAWQILEFCGGVNTIVQTVAGGYGPLGMEEGFRRAATVSDESVLHDRRYMLYQASDADGLGRAWRTGKHTTTVNELDLPSAPFEPTLQSTNPVATLPALRQFLPQSSSIASVDISQVPHAAAYASLCLEEVGISLDFGREYSTLIAFSGLLNTRFDPQARLAIIVSGSAPFTSAK